MAICARALPHLSLWTRCQLLRKIKIDLTVTFIFMQAASLFKRGHWLKFMSDINISMLSHHCMFIKLTRRPIWFHMQCWSDDICSWEDQTRGLMFSGKSPRDNLWPQISSDSWSAPNEVFHSCEPGCSEQSGRQLKALGSWPAFWIPQVKILWRVFLRMWRRYQYPVRHSNPEDKKPPHTFDRYCWFTWWFYYADS